MTVRTGVGESVQLLSELVRACAAGLLVRVSAAEAKVRVTAKASTTVADIVPAWVAMWAKCPGNAKSRSLLML